MEWNDKEKKIIGQLQRHTETVDTEALWRGIQPNLPVRRKRMWLPFFLFFLGGLGTGIGGYYVMDNDAPQIPEVSSTAWAEEKAELLQQLKTCLETSNTVITNQNNKPSNVQPSVRNQKQFFNPVTQNQTNPFATQNLPAYIPATETTKIPETPAPTSKDVGLNIKDVVNVDELNPKSVELFDNKATLLVEPIFLNPTDKPSSKWLQYLMAGAGPTFVTDRLSYENTTKTTLHRPMYHYALEYGLHKRLFKNLMGNIGINYTGMASHIRYQTTKTETFSVTDTIGYFIGPDGLMTTETGEVLATKVTKKNGKTYQYSQSLFIHPSLEYDIPLRKSSSLSIKAGLMIPLVRWQKSSFLNPEGEVIKQTPAISYFERPMLRGGVTYQTILYHKTIGFYLDFLLGSQNIQTETYSTARTLFFPQTGMRIFF
ncbi:MAG: hypothetical protein IPN79_11460 [Saprospiraceae bacterium]|nr:hypothetical protein [Saprospiraceae bacterium]